MTRLIAALTLVAGIALTGCQRTDPCDQLGAPHEDDIASAARGNEVERELGDVECVVQGDRWVAEYDS
jgi:hypothetical protein